MQESEELRKQVLCDLRACLISSQGGIPVNSLNNDYKQLIGEYIPFKKVGYSSLDSFLKSVPEICLKNVNGTVLVEARTSESSNHITNLVSRQKRSGRKRSRKSQQIKRLSRLKSNKPLTLPPRYSKNPNRQNGFSKSNTETRHVQKGGQDHHAPSSRNYTNPPSTSANSNQPKPLMQQPSSSQPKPLLQQPSSNQPKPLPKQPTSTQPKHSQPNLPPPHHHPQYPLSASQQQHYIPVRPRATPLFVNPNICQPPQHPAPVLPRAYGTPIQHPPLYRAYNPQPLLTPYSEYNQVTQPYRNVDPIQVVKQQTVELCQQFQGNDLQLKNVSQFKSRQAQRGNKLSVFESIPLPSSTSLSKDAHYFKLLDFVKSREWPDPEVHLFRQRNVGTITCIVSVTCAKPGHPPDMSVGVQEFTTYPDETTDVKVALEKGTKKAYDTIIQITSENYPLTKDTKLMLDRLSEMVKDKTNGIWAFQIETDYAKKYKEGLPPKWIEIVKNSNVLYATNLGYSYVVLPYQDEDSEKMISPCHKVRSLTIPKLILPESEQWDVYVSKAQSYSEIWVRLIGDDYSQELENLTTEIELYYYDDKSPSVNKVEVNKYYVALCDDSAFRIIIRECYENEALVHFVDYGDEEVLPLEVIKELIPKFYTLPSQALLVNLSGLEYTSKIEYREEFMDKIVGKSYIALVEERDPYSLVLFDTSENNDIDVNKTLLHSILSATLYQPIVLKVGSVKEIRICHIDENGQVYIRLEANPAWEFLQERLECIERGECEIFNVMKLNFNKMYFIRYMDKLHRVIANPTGSFSKEKVYVYFIDEGISMTVVTSELFELNDEEYDVLSNIPHQALKIYLKDIPPFKLTPKKIQKLREIAPPTRPIISKVVEITDLPTLELFIRNQSDKLLSSVNHSIELEDILESATEVTLLDKSFDSLRITNSTPKQVDTSCTSVTSSKSKLSFDGTTKRSETNHISNTSERSTPKQSDTLHSPKVMPTQLNDKDIFRWEGDGDVFPEYRVEIPPIGKLYFEIYVADTANPSNFTVQPLKYLPDLNKLTAEMKQFYDNTKPSVSSPLDYDVFAVKHSDGYWYRAVVYRIFNDNITVRLCDYGNLDVVNVHKLRPLHKKFMELPFLGIKARLAGILPKHKDWSVNDCITLKQMIKGKKLISVIRDILHLQDETVICLDITDTSSNTDMNISHQFVLEGRAVYDL